MVLWKGFQVPLYLAPSRPQAGATGSADAEVGDERCQRRPEDLRQSQQSPQRRIGRTSGTRLTLLILLTRVPSQPGTVGDILLAEPRALPRRPERRRQTLRVRVPLRLGLLVSMDHDSSVETASTWYCLMGMAQFSEAIRNNSCPVGLRPLFPARGLPIPMPAGRVLGVGPRVRPRLRWWL